MQVETELELTMLAGDEVHLNALEEKWLSCEPMKRTTTSNEAWVELNVRNRTSGAVGVMTIPDLRGENFERPLVAGGCSRDLHDALVLSDGILLFTNANREDDMLLIDDFGDMPEDDDGEGSEEEPAGDASVEAVDMEAIVANEAGAERAGEAEADGDEAGGKFRPEDMAEEVKIVEFLQMANRRPLRPKLRKIALVASAWDLVGGEEGLTPKKWLARKRPMLAQFLSNKLRAMVSARLRHQRPGWDTFQKGRPSSRRCSISPCASGSSATKPLSTI